MSAECNLEVYDYDAVEAEHKSRGFPSIDLDWPSRTVVILAGKKWIIRYQNGDRDSLWWFCVGNAFDRVKATLEAVGPAAVCDIRA